MAFFKQNFIDRVTTVTAAWLNGIQEVVGAAAVAPEYSDEQIYSIGTLVSHDAQLYICSTTIATPEQWTAGHWTATSLESLLALKANTSDMALSIYPVGSIYMSVNDANPSTLFGGTWERITGKFLLAATDSGSSGASQAAGNTGGSATHSITTSEMPTHSHSISQQYLHRVDSTDNNYANFGDGGSLSGWDLQMASTNNAGVTRLGIPAHNTNDSGSGTAMSIMPPYLSVYVWKRTA